VPREPALENIDGDAAGGAALTDDRRSRLYLWLAGLFVAALLTADLIGSKFFRVGSIDLSVGMLAFPLTFVITDVLNEFFGPRGARRVTFLGLGAALFAFAIIQLAIALPTSPESPLPAQTFATVFGWSQRLYIASLTAYMVGQLLDISLFTVLRRLTRQRLLWLRATGSTLGSQLVDTTVVTTGLLIGVKPAGFIAGVVRDSYIMKVVIAIALTPLIYLAHGLILRLLARSQIRPDVRPDLRSDLPSAD
jgi:queuosine precursor transporter